MAQTMWDDPAAKRAFVIALLFLVLIFGCRKTESGLQLPEKPGQESLRLEPAKPAAVLERTGDFLTTFSGPIPLPRQRNPNVSYSFVLPSERYFVHVSPQYSAEAPYGLIVFTDASDELNQLPEGWPEVLDNRKYLFIAAQNVGNGQEINRRLGLAVLGALEMMQHYRIDSNRVYAAGFSGGARMSSLLGFYQSDVFHGTIQNCGTDFYRPVPVVAATSPVDTAGEPYGLLAVSATPDEIAAAKRVRFALITGTRDFRRGNIVDIFNGGFAKDGFQAKLFDVSGMEHDVADARTLSSVIDFLESAR